MTTYIVTAKGATALKIGDAPVYEGQPIPAESWDTRASLQAQGFILYIPDAIANAGTTLPETFPHKEVLEDRGYRTLEAVHYLSDKQLIELPEIGEAAVRNIRFAVASFRGEEVLTKDEVELSDVLTDSEANVILLVRGERQLPISGDEIELGSAEMALLAIFANAGVLPAFLPIEQREVLLLGKPDFDPAAILQAIVANDYKLSEPMSLLLERLGLTYPPAPAPEPQEDDVPPAAELQHPTSDAEKDADVKAEDSTKVAEPALTPVKPRGKAASKPKG